MFQVVVPEYAYWPRWPAPPNGSPAAYAWPDSPAAVVALANDSRWDLLRYDAARGEIVALGQDLQLPLVVGYDNQDRFLAHFVQSNGQRLLAARQLGRRAWSW